MKHQRQWKYLFMVWGMGCIMACNGDETAVFDALAKIEAQGDTAATVALQRLEQMKQTVDEQQDEHLTNKYKLLGIRLRDKAYITHTSMDEPMRVMAYFEKKGTTEERLEASYYMASVCRDLKDYPQAMDYFQRVACHDTAGASRKTLQLTRNACSQLTYIYRLVMLPEEAYETAVKGLDVSERLEERSIVLLMDVAQTAMETKRTVEGLASMNEVFDKLQKSGEWTTHADITAELIQRYAEEGDTARMEACKAALEHLPPQQQPDNYPRALFYYYKCHQQTDSMCKVQERIAEKSESWARRANSARWLAQHYLKHRDMTGAERYSHLMFQAMDSVLEERKAKQTAISSGQHKYIEIKERSHQAMMQAEKAKRHTWQLLFVSTTILLMGSLLFLLTKKKHAQQMAQRKQELDAAHEREQTAMDVIENQERTIKQKNSELKTMSAHIRQLIYHNNQTYGRDDMKRVCKDFDEMSNGKKRPEAEDWNRLMAVVDHEHPEFAAELHSRLKRMNSDTLRTAYLWKIGLDPTKISHIMYVHRQTTWDRIERIAAALHAKQETT